ncbi:hypothetical protein [Cerasicoccus frondis]|uniref:hypothetical protein n=1 Tax=Cerasicoccus frondis TaxID=490090 RepID=UPI00285254A7|nr:hypothetical protein [Cerasicoccus frondis]
MLIGHFLVAGCAKKSPKEDVAPLPKAASNFIANNEQADVEMPHTVDVATEFPAALESVQIGSRKPELRGVEAGHNVVRVEKAPAISKPGQATTPKDLERDWDGTVLIPAGTQMSHAHTDNVEFGRIEAHPLADGSLRVWVRVKNIVDRDLEIRIACNFQSVTQEQMKTAFVSTEIPVGDAIDVYFMSPMPNVISYTILAR